jgi:hypothetical protein
MIAHQILIRISWFGAFFFKEINIIFKLQHNLCLYLFSVNISPFYWTLELCVCTLSLCKYQLVQHTRSNIILKHHFLTTCEQKQRNFNANAMMI